RSFHSLFPPPTTTFTSTLSLHDALPIFGANYFNQTFSDFNNSFNTKAMGLFLSPAATINGKPIHGAPNIVIGNFEQIGLTPPEGRSDLTWHATDIVSYNRGAHQFRFGGEVRQAHVNEFYHRRGTGKFTFDGSQGPWPVCNQTDPTLKLTCQDTNALSDFLAGNVAGGPLDPDVTGSTIAVGNRSEERRVGKECRYRWATDQ